MSSYGLDPFDSRFKNFFTILNECLKDNEPNEVIQQSIQRYFDSYNDLINDQIFCYHFFGAVIANCLQSGVGSGDGTVGSAVNKTKLMERSKLLSKLVHNYIEYQLNLLLVLCEIKVRLNLSDDTFDLLVNILHSSGVISTDAKNHWFKCKMGFDKRWETIRNTVQFLDWTAEAREEHFYETNFDDID